MSNIGKSKETKRRPALITGLEEETEESCFKQKFTGEEQELEVVGFLICCKQWLVCCCWSREGSFIF